MASESTGDGSLTVSVPGDLNDWLEERATQLDVDRETVLIQLLASYRAAAQLDSEHDGDGPPFPVADADELVDTEDIADDVEATLRPRINEAIDTAVSEATGGISRELSERIDAVERDYREKLEDVRDRVVQVKKETDSKAPADHTHPELDRVSDQLSTLAADVSELEAAIEDLEETVGEHDDAVADADERLDEIQDRLQTVAWVVTDLRESYESRGLEAVDRIKRAAAKADVDRAKCEECGNGVDIALLTDPECPHCQTTVTNVEAADGFFSKPKLLVASQLGSGEE